MTSPTSVVLPSDPILDAVEARGGMRVLLGLEPRGGRFGGARVLTAGRHADTDVKRWMRVYQRMRQSGVITVYAADRFCIHVLGVNPALVYGAEWWEAA